MPTLMDMTSRKPTLAEMGMRSPTEPDAQSIANAWLDTDADFSIASMPTVDQQAKDAMAIASQYHVPVEQAIGLAQYHTWSGDIANAINKGNLQLVKGLLRLGSGAINQPRVWDVMAMGTAPMDTSGMIDTQPRKPDEEIEDPLETAARGIGELIATHPEWDSEPPKNVVDLLTHPRKLTVALASSMPQLAAAGLLTATGHPVAAAALVYASEGEQAYDYVIANAGTVEEGKQARIIYGSVAAALEMFQIRTGIKLVKEMRNLVIAKAAKKLTAEAAGKEIGQGLAKRFVQETVTEMMQGAWQEKTGQMVAGIERPGGWAYVDRRLQEATIAGVLTLTGAAGGASLATVSRGVSIGEPITTPDGWTSIRFPNEDVAEQQALQMWSVAQQKGNLVEIKREGSTVRYRSPLEVKPRPSAGQAALIAKEDEYSAQLLEKAETGDEQAWDQLNDLVQRRNLPTYEELLDRAMAGDTEAANEIQIGRYRYVPGAGKTEPTVPAEGAPVVAGGAPEVVQAAQVQREVPGAAPPGGMAEPRPNLPQVVGEETPGATETVAGKESPIVKFRQIATEVEKAIPPVPDGYTRLWRGNRAGGKDTGNPSYTTALDGVALPFQEAYGGNLTYVDVPTTDLSKYTVRGGVPGEEFILPKDVAGQSRIVDPGILSQAKAKIGQPATGQGATVPAQATGTALPETSQAGPITREEKNYLKEMGFAVSDILKMDPRDAREKIQLHQAASRGAGGFLRFRFNKEKQTQEKIAQAMKHFEDWLAKQGTTPEEVLEFGPEPQDPDAPTRERAFIETLKENELVGKEAHEEYHVRHTDTLAIKAANLVRDDPAAAEKRARRGENDGDAACAIELLKAWRRQAEQETDPTKRAAIEEKALDLSYVSARSFTAHGQYIQAATIASLDTPEGMIRFAIRTIDDYNAHHKKNQLPNLTPEQMKHITDEMAAIGKLTDNLEKARRLGQLTDYVHGLVPSTWFDQLMYVIRAGMLTGLKTHAINIGSNTIHMGLEIVKDVPAAGIDKMLGLVSGKRTTFFTVSGTGAGLSKGGREGLTYFRTGWSERDTVANKLEMRGTKLWSPKLQYVLQWVYRSMGAEDQPFYYCAMYRSLASSAAAQAFNDGLTGEKAQARAQELLDKPTEDMVIWSLKDAEIAVFANRTALGDVAAAIIRGLPGTALIVPFTRTPSAIAMQILNYTPVGAVKALVENVANYDQRAFSQALGRSVTGSALLWLGYELFKSGLMSLDRPETERERELWKVEGRQANSIRIGNAWHSIQVLGPAGIAMMIGAHFASKLKETGSPTQAMVSACAGGGKSFSEQTFLRGFNVAVSALVEPDRSLESFTSSMAGMVVPTILADIARATDRTERRVTGLGGQRVMSRFPVARWYLEPSITVLGQDLPRYGGNIIQVMVDPTRPCKVKQDVVVDEVRRLWDLGYRTAAPTLLGDRKGYKALTANQNTELWRRAGEVSYVKMFESMRSPEYQYVNDEAKAKLLADAVEDGKLLARTEMAYALLSPMAPDQRLRKMFELRESGLIVNTVARELEKLL